MAVEGIFTWYGLADLCAQAGIPCVRGPALSMTVNHGGTAQTAKIDAHTVAGLRRRGLLPQADVDPAAGRATRDWLRRPADACPPAQPAGSRARARQEARL